MDQGCPRSPVTSKTGFLNARSLTSARAGALLLPTTPTQPPPCAPVRPSRTGAMLFLHFKCSVAVSKQPVPPAPPEKSVLAAIPDVRDMPQMWQTPARSPCLTTLQSLATPHALPWKDTEGISSAPCPFLRISLSSQARKISQRLSLTTLDRHPSGVFSAESFGMDCFDSSPSVTF